MDTENQAPNGPGSQDSAMDRTQLLQGGSATPGGGQGGGAQTPPPAKPRKKSYGDAVHSFYSDPATRKLALVTTGVAIVAIGFGGYRVLAGPSAPHVKIQDQVQTPRLSGAPGGDKGSKAFDKQLNQANAQMGAEAAKAGQTYVPTPSGLHPTKPKPTKPKPAPKPAVKTPTPVVANPYTPQQAQAAAKQQNAELTAMTTELKRFDTNASYAPVQVYTINKAPKSTASSANSNALNALQAQETVLANPGYLAYGMLDSSVNSNVPGPILATVESGKFKGARLLGAFKREHFRDVLQFSQMTWKHQDYHISAYAISPKNAQVGMATSVNDHILYRYGMLFAGSFLQGLSEALTDSDENVVAGNGYAIVTHELNNGQILEDAAGNVGNTLAPIAEQQFNIPPTVRVAAGTGMGILFMDVVKGKEDVQ